VREEEVEKRHPTEQELFPRRWLVKNEMGVVRVITQDSRPSLIDSRTAVLMGTDETVEHAAKRVGWAA
jgi:hypothetical protein